MKFWWLQAGLVCAMISASSSYGERSQLIADLEKYSRCRRCAEAGSLRDRILEAVNPEVENFLLSVAQVGDLKTFEMVLGSLFRIYDDYPQIPLDRLCSWVGSAYFSRNTRLIKKAQPALERLKKENQIKLLELIAPLITFYQQSCSRKIALPDGVQEVLKVEANEDLK